MNSVIIQTSDSKTNHLNLAISTPKKGNLFAQWFVADDGKLVCKWFVD